MIRSNHKQAEPQRVNTGRAQGRILASKMPSKMTNKRRQAMKWKWRIKWWYISCPAWSRYLPRQPAGIGLYWCVSTIYGIAQQLVVNYQADSQKAKWRFLIHNKNTMIETQLQQLLEDLLNRLTTPFRKFALVNWIRGRNIYRLNIESEEPSLLIDDTARIFRSPEYHENIAWRKLPGDYKITVDADDYAKAGSKCD